MKTLLLMRHAKSSHDEPGTTDHDRPLNERGRRDAPRMAELLREHELIPDVIISSTAVRARETAQLVAETLDFDGPLDAQRTLYLTSADAYLDACRALVDEPATVLVIGHNPSMAELVARLSDDYHEFPTAALAHFELKIKSWADLRRDVDAKLKHLWRPKEV